VGEQWDKFPAELDASVLLRIPVRLNTDDRYFTDPFQALPKEGYTKIFENMLLGDPNITIRLRWVPSRPPPPRRFTTVGREHWRYTQQGSSLLR
jgi:UDP-galactopyranose mutase